MHAIRLHAFGPAENLRYEEVAAPEPAAGQVRIAVEAAGVHLIDTRLRAGIQMGPLPLPDLPAIPGREVAGTVEAVGDDAGGSWLGRRVVAHLGPAGGGGYAELAVVGADALHAIPDDVTAETAVATIGTGRTTMGILEAAALTDSDTVLIPAAAGGIGALLVQAARRAGAEVVALAGGAAKVDEAKRLGATFAVDYTDARWPETVRDLLDGDPVSVVLDGVGGATGAAALDLLGPGGRMVVFGWSSGAPSETTRDDVTMLRLPRPTDLRALETAALDAVATGALTPLVGPPFALADAAAAHTALESRATVGKVVLLP
ncbi:MAG TPA: zinc-binding dehydrogenase [Baekduia sp.]|nr:zinc-binding dehydrogenase [Baekduia sp.]